MKKYKLINNIIGWILFLVAFIVYQMTIEPTTSFWDCGEYIATAYKIQVGHPPGAPTFQLLGRIFSLFAFGDTALVARMINSLSAFSSALTVMFLFWTITMMGKKMVSRSERSYWPVLLAAFVGALGFAFSDSFWFSAVEGEVYATSSFFTAITFWSILKWEQRANNPGNIRWIIFIFFLIGLSIGVHLLNLLAIPAVVFVFYFKKYKTSVKGILLAFLLSVFLIWFILYAIIPYIIKLSVAFELFFVNSINMPFHSGTIIYFVVLSVAIVMGLRHAHKKRKVILSTILLCFSFLLIGYFSFFTLIIRSNANPPIDENNPENAISLLAYLQREQYGKYPLIYGQYYNAPIVDYKDGKPLYAKDSEKEKYVIVDPAEDTEPVYDKRFMTIFPRMYSPRSPRGGHTAYHRWADIKGKSVQVIDPQGKTEVRKVPSFWKDNVPYFFKYQLGFMYFRYFMWNFAGRQNDIQGNGNILDGNWISGIHWLDEMRLGPQKNIPELLENKGRNSFYMLPLLLGIIGMVFHLLHHKKYFLVVLLLFFFTGIAIVIYLNQPPNEPRERDYAYAASFYAFSIWMGLGVLALFNFFKRYMGYYPAILLSGAAGIFAAPYLMASQGWDDHDRSNRYTARAMAYNYLNSCADNAIIFTNGDNDTFPLWYIQEVEGVRTDVRVCNLNLLVSDWYVEQMKKKAYDSEPVPSTIPLRKYGHARMDYFPVIQSPNLSGYVNINDVIDFIIDDNPRTKLYGKMDYIPTEKISIPVDSATVVKQNLAEEKDKILRQIEWDLPTNVFMRNGLMVLDILGNQNWERPIYFASTMGPSSYYNLENYFRFEGMAYRLIPAKAVSYDNQTGMINTEVLYDHLMNKFIFGNMNDPDVYMDEENRKMAMNLRNTYNRLAFALIREGKKDSAIQVLDYIFEKIPESSVPFNNFVVPLAQSYYYAGAFDKGNAIMARVLELYDEYLEYLSSFPREKLILLKYQYNQALQILSHIEQTSKQMKQQEIHQKASESLNIYSAVYQNIYSF